MNIAPPQLSATLQAPPAAPPPPPPAPGGSSPFAKLLSAQRPGKGGDVANTMDAKNDAAAPGTDAAEPSEQDGAANKPAAGRRGPPRGLLRAGIAQEAKAARAGAKAQSPLAAGAEPADEAAAAKASAADGTLDASAPAPLDVPPALPASAAAAPTAATGVPGAPPQQRGELPSGLTASPLSNLALNAVRGGAAAAAAARDARLPLHDAAAKPTEAAAQAGGMQPLADPVRDAASEPAGLQLGALKERLDPRAELAAAPPSNAAGPLAALPATGRPDAAARAGAAAALALTTPVSAPEFREALGVQVSVLARNGVQHAQLQLNPAEMGPISVQIAIDGTRAQVDFGADSFATRQIIESGLPELAAALRDAGFTLAGGGVSQHSRGSAGGGEAQPAPAGSAQPRDAAGEAGPAGTRIQLRAPLGAVDLYA